MPQLKVILHDTGEMIHDLTESQITIGRSSENFIQIEEASVSTRHATLMLDQSGEYILRDVGSTNGSKLNGNAISPNADHKLQNLDKITFGSVDALYMSETLIEARPLPEPGETSAVVATNSARPADFSNASPFQTKRRSRDTVGILILVLAAIAIGAWAYALSLVYAMRPPEF